MAKTIPLELPEIEVALAKSYRVAPFKLLLIIFWGLILAKCCIVEWAIINYSTPINGLLYVWIPSIAFGGICSLVYAHISFEELRRAPLISRLIRGVWSACAISMVILCIVSFGAQSFNSFVLPGFFAILMGIGYYIHSILDSRRIFKICAVGWWFSSLLLFSVLNVHSLAWLALAIVLFQIVPTIFFYTKANKDYRQIVSQRGAAI